MQAMQAIIKQALEIAAKAGNNRDKQRDAVQAIKELLSQAVGDDDSNEAIMISAAVDGTEEWEAIDTSDGEYEGEYGQGLQETWDEWIVGNLMQGLE